MTGYLIRFKMKKTVFAQH